jgi:hypothetical protein
MIGSVWIVANVAGFEYRRSIQFNPTAFGRARGLFDHLVALAYTFGGILRILDFRFLILDCSVIGSLYPLSPAHSAEEGG